jgi:tetratricopeptide (TPR) repeat protein
MFKLSESQNYLSHVRFEYNGNLPWAIHLMELCIEEVRQHPEEDFLTLAFLFQRLGSLKYRNGEIDEAFELYERTLEMDKDSVLFELGYAKFLTRDCANYLKAIKKCDAIITTVTDANYIELENSPSAEYYLREANALKEECLAKIEEQQ